MSKPVINIGVVSDVVCPWCYIGKRRLEKAINILSDKYDFQVAYYPFELNAEMPLSGKPQKEYLINKFGDEEQYEQLTTHVATVASNEGLTFDFEKQLISPNTRDAHRLILFSKENNKQLEMVEALFKAYFTDGVDLTKTENLVAIAGSIGLNEKRVDEFLKSDKGLAEVIMAENELQRLGVRGVPFYIINDKYGISGAQPAEAFMQAFENVGKDLVSASEVCDVDSKNC